MLVRFMELMLTKSEQVRNGGQKARLIGGAMERRGSVRAAVGVMVLAVAMAAPSVVLAQAPAQTQIVTSAATPQDLGATQQRLMQLLRVSPALAEVVSSDPSLLANQEYVAKSNPELAT